jgi:large subunit ribosomal protein L1
MGKIRVKTIGIEGDEKDQKKKAKDKAEAKRIEAAKKAGQAASAKGSGEPKEAKAAEQTLDEVTESTAKNAQEIETPVATKAKTEKKTKKEKFQTKKSKPHSSKYLKVADQVDRNKKYTLKEALEILPKLKTANFDETVELHINTHEKGVSGSITLPHGTGKQMKVETADYTTDSKHVDELIKNINAGQIDFDILIATPDTMVHLAKVARVLGPRGLMPNPKNGTVHPKPAEAAKKFEGGQINFKTEPKAPIIHMTFGKVSFEQKQLNENINAIFKAVQSKNIKNVTLKSTMSPGIKLSL